MKNINFIKTLSIANQRALGRWWFFSCALCILCIVLVLCAHGLQLYHWYALSGEHRTFQTTLQGMSESAQTYEKLCTEQKLLQQKKSKCDRVVGGMVQMRELLTAVRSACTDGTLQSCKWDKQSVELTLESPTAVAATQSLAQVQKIKGLETVQLVSLHPSRNSKLLASMRSKK